MIPGRTTDIYIPEGGCERKVKALPLVCAYFNLVGHRTLRTSPGIIILSVKLILSVEAMYVLFGHQTRGLFFLLLYRSGSSAK